jgi:hypothetical protein
MRGVTYRELLETAGFDHQRLKVLRQRGQVALAFGRSDIYESLGYIELDCVAALLADVLTEKLDRTLAAEIVRDQWGVWSRVVAAAEASGGVPAFFYVVEYENQKGKRWHMTVGSMLDSLKERNLREIAEDLRKRAGVTARNYVVVEMQSILADVRANAKRAKHDFSAPFLPPYGSAELEEVLRPFDEDMPDRAVVITDRAKEEAAEHARRAGIRARASVEASLPAIRGRRQ